MLHHFCRFLLPYKLTILFPFSYSFLLIFTHPSALLLLLASNAPTAKGSEKKKLKLEEPARIAELEAKHEEELAKLKAASPDEDSKLEAADEDEEQTPATSGLTYKQNKGPSKAQKKKEKKRQQEKEARERALKEAAAMPDLKQQELALIGSRLESQKLAVKDVSIPSPIRFRSPQPLSIL